MKKSLFIAVIALLTVLPAQAQQATKKTPKSFAEKKEISLKRAGMKLSKAKRKYDCINAAQTMAEMNNCYQKKKKKKKKKRSLASYKCSQDRRQREKSF